MKKIDFLLQNCPFRLQVPSDTANLLVARQSLFINYKNLLILQQQKTE